MSLPSPCLHSQGPHLAVSRGEKNWENSRLVRAKTLTVNIKERQRRREEEKDREREREKENQLLERPEHIISTALSLHTQGTLEKGGRPLNGKGSNKKSKLL